MRSSLIGAQARALVERGGLSLDETTALSRAVRAGDRTASETLVASVYLLIVRDAHKIAAVAGDDVDDLVQEACLGTLRAAEKFDPSRGVFGTYATWWARAYMLKFSLNNKRMVKVGTTNAQRKVVFGLSKAVRALEASGRETSDAAVAEYLGVLEREVGETRRRLGSRDASLDGAWNHSTKTYDDDVIDRCLLDDLAGDDTPADELLDERRRREWLEQRLLGVAETLTLQEQDVLCDNLLAEDPTPLAEIATWHRVTRMRMAQVKQRLLEKLRRHMGVSVTKARRRCRVAEAVA